VRLFYFQEVLMPHSFSSSTGAPANGGKIQTPSTLHYLVSNQRLRPTIKSFLLRQLASHLTTYTDWCPDSSFRLVELADLIFIETNNDKLVKVQYDAPYIRQLLEEDQLETEELEAA
jgi:hypothetical protein